MKEFRELKGNDIFKVSRILSKMDIKIEITEGMTQEQAGAELVLKIFSNLHLAQKEVNEFLGSLTGMTGKEVGELPLSEYLDYIEAFKNIDGIKDFLERASKLTK